VDTPPLTTGVDPCDCTLQFSLRVAVSALIFLACGVAARAYALFFLILALIGVWPAQRSYSRCKRSCGPIESSWLDSSGTAPVPSLTTIDHERRGIGAEKDTPAEDGLRARASDTPNYNPHDVLQAPRSTFF